MKKLFTVLAITFALASCKKADDVEPLGLVGKDTTLTVDSTTLAGLDSLSWQHIARLKNGVNDPRNECQLTQSYTYRRDGYYHFYSLPGSPCFYAGTTDTFTVKGDSLILGAGLQASHRMKVLKLANDTLRVTFTDVLSDASKIVYIDTFIPHK